MIHSTAIIDPTAEIADGVSVGAYAVIGPHVKIGENTEIHHHVILEGPTTIGKNNKIFPFASIGLEPQDKKFKGEETFLEIGDNNVIREYVTMNRGTGAGGGLTKLGDDGWIMAYCHIAHDCLLGNGIVMANAATLAGHVTIKDKVTIGGLTGIHQFCKIGEYSLIGGQSMVTQDVAPYTIVAGNRAKLSGLNYVGLERNGFSKAQVKDINQAFKIFFKSGNTKNDAVEKLKESYPDSPHIQMLIDFVISSERGVCR